MKWMPEEVAYGLKEALKDLKDANSKSKKRLLSRKRPISTTAFVNFIKNFEGFMPGDWTTRADEKRLWINVHMIRVIDEICGREPTPMPKRAAAGDEEEDGDPEASDAGADDVDDLIPADLAVGDDEVGGGLPAELFATADDTLSNWSGAVIGQLSEPEPDLQATYHDGNIDSATEAPASGLDSMMSKMSIGKGSSRTGSGVPAPTPQAAVK